MRKLLSMLLLALFISVCAGAALAETDYVLSPAPLQITLSDKAQSQNTVLTADNLGAYPQWLTKMGMSQEEALADWASRGVVLQLWKLGSSPRYQCLEVSVTQDDESAQYYDLMNHPEDRTNWNLYKSSFMKDEKWTAAGYTFQKSEITKSAAGQYLILQYKRTVGSETYRGTMARTVFRGYTLVMDLRVYNQSVKPQDRNDIVNLMKTLTVVENAAVPASDTAGEAGGTVASSGAADGSADSAADSAAAANVSDVGFVPLEITQAPPRETNTNSFTVTGATEPGAHVVGVLMHMNSNDSWKFEADAHAKNGSFTLKVTLPDENAWSLTLNVFVKDKLSAFKSFDYLIIYKKTLLPVTLDEEVPETIAADELVIAGTTVKAVDVQCLVTNEKGETVSEQKSHPNGTGRFTFKIKLKDEGRYEIALVVSKKGYDTKRFIYHVERFLTEEARRVQQRKEAARGAYNAVAARMDQYIGKILYFSATVVSVEQVGDEWLIWAGLSKSGDHYNQLLVYKTEQEPSLETDEKHTFYGTCTGPYQVQSEETTESYPCFDLLFFD